MAFGRECRTDSPASANSFAAAPSPSSRPTDPGPPLSSSTEPRNQAAVEPRAIIAEDEPLLARALRKELAKLWPTLEVIATPENGPEAAAIALRELPDVIFLDVQMPGASGLDVATEVADEWPEGRVLPLLVFVTAFDQYAVQAFERAAIDYLIKPVAPERMAMTVHRLRERLSARTSSRPGESVP